MRVCPRFSLYSTLFSAQSVQYMSGGLYELIEPLVMPDPVHFGELITITSISRMELDLIRIVDWLASDSNPIAFNKISLFLSASLVWLRIPTTPS